MEYQEFIKEKTRTFKDVGFKPTSLNKHLYDFQKYAVTKALQKGRFALFEDCGLGKTLQLLAWSESVSEHTNKPVIILSPLAVVEQTILQGTNQFGVKIERYDPLSDCLIQITNYDQLENIDQEKFCGVVLDESSMLKSSDGKTRNLLIEKFRFNPFKLCCSATPSPNDHMELGSHAEFLNVMSYSEMLAMYFVHDGGDTSKWRLRKHAEADFWAFVSSWSLAMDNPSRFGFNEKSYSLPGLNYIEHLIPVPVENGELFASGKVSATDINSDLRKTITQRVQKVKEIIESHPDKQWIIWGLQNAETDLLEKEIPGSINVQGKDSPEFKSQKLIGFAKGEFKYLITKPSIASFGLNYQSSHNQIFCSYDFKFETFYQAVRRQYRFGQKENVNVHLLIPESQLNVRRSIIEKEKKHKEMIQKMAEYSVNNYEFKDSTCEVRFEETENYTCIQGDCVEQIKKIKDESVHLTVFSPPFAELYVYSDKPQDMGNSRNYKEFKKHFQYLVPELYRVLMPGRITAVHCMDLPIQKGKEGYIGLRDFSGMLVRMFCGISEEEMGIIDSVRETLDRLKLAGCEKEESFKAFSNWIEDIEERQANFGGFIYHSRVTIWKNPVTEMQRTKALGLLHKQVKKDSSMSRVGIPDYVLFFRKKGENPVPIKNESIPVDLWQKYASPVWYDVDYKRTLQYTTARDSNDEKHIAPLQLETIERVIHLYSNPSETILSPFGGIGSEGFQALKMGRKSISIELKQSYFNVNLKNHRSAIESESQLHIFK